MLSHTIGDIVAVICHEIISESSMEVWISVSVCVDVKVGRSLPSFVYAVLEEVLHQLIAGQVLQVVVVIPVPLQVENRRHVPELADPKLLKVFVACFPVFGAKSALQVVVKTHVPTDVKQDACHSSLSYPKFQVVL